MKDLDKPWYRSKKVIVLQFVGLLLLALTQLGAPTEVTEKLARALEFGLAALIGVQGYADARGVVVGSKGKPAE